jgi:hypothetical protein
MAIGFVADVSMAAYAMVSQPTVVLVTVLFWSVPALNAANQSAGGHVNHWLLLASLATVLVMCGWAGVERVFFFSHFAGKPVTLRHLLSLVTAFMGRFVTLGLAIGAAFIPCMIVLGMAVPGSLGKERHGHLRVVVTIFGVAMDLALTFVPAALALTTRSVRRAIRIGLAMIRDTWPRSALYVLCPVIAFNMNRLAYPANLPALRLIAAAGLAVIALLAKGATVAFYLRQRPAYDPPYGPDGAAHILE